MHVICYNNNLQHTAEIKDGTREGETLTTIESGGVRRSKWTLSLGDRDRGEVVVNRRMSRYCAVAGFASTQAKAWGGAQERQLPLIDRLMLVGSH